MIVPIVIIGSLGAAYFTYVLYKKQSRKIAATVVGVNYIFLLFWIYYVFVVDIFGFGLTSYKDLAIFLYGKELYPYIAELEPKIVAIPTPILLSLAVVTFFALFAGIFAVLHGTARAVNVIFDRICKKHIKIGRIRAQKRMYFHVASVRNIPLIRLYCRANC